MTVEAQSGQFGAEIGPALPPNPIIDNLSNANDGLRAFAFI
jgi:hypothetical protein